MAIKKTHTQNRNTYTKSLGKMADPIFLNVQQNKTIYAEWTLLPELFGPIHFQFKGCLVSFNYYHALKKCLLLMQTM